MAGDEPRPDPLRPGPVVLFGGGGHAQSIASVLTRIGAWVVAVADPLMDTSGWGPCVALLSDDEAGVRRALERDLPAVVAIGDNRLRLGLARRLLERGVRLPYLQASTATLAEDIQIGVGSIVLEHAHVGPSSVLGAACIVNTAAIVEHHCTLGDAVHVGPAGTLCGAVVCGRGALIGAGATVAPYGVVRDRAVVGAGAVVIGQVPEHTTVVGVPADVVRRP